MTAYRGSCHCGSIGFTYVTPLPAKRWPIRACQCSFCRAHDALSTSDPDGSIEFSADNGDFLQRYRFGLKTADFLLCRQCGVYIGALIETGNGSWGIINVHALCDAPSNLAAVAPIDYDGEESDGRIARRERRWTPSSLTA